MKKHTFEWTTQRVDRLRELRRAGWTCKQIAEFFKISLVAVERKWARIRCSVTAATSPEPEDILGGAGNLNPAPVEDKSRIDYWKGRAAAAEKELAQAQSAKTAVEVLSEQMHELAPKAYAPPPFHNNPEFKKPGGTPQSAVLMFSDTHIGAVVKPEQTLGMGGYNFELFLRRLKRLEKSVFSILEDHTTTPIAEIVIPILGDMLDGALTHSAESGQANTLLAQFYSGGHAIAQFLRNLSVLAPVRLHGCVGNHTRWQNQHKMPTKNRNSNFDQLLYLYVQALTRDIPRIQWHLDWQPFATFEVQGFPFYALHGDNIRGGDKMLGIPNHSIGRMVGTTTQLFSRAKKDIPAYYLLGHLHRGIELPHANGEVLVNGAFPGIDGFALSEYFNSSRPMQRFFLMHPKFGVAAGYKLRLDLGDETPHDYQLPEQFPCQ